MYKRKKEREREGGAKRLVDILIGAYWDWYICIKERNKEREREREGVERLVDILIGAYWDWYICIKERKKEREREREREGAERLVDILIGAYWDWYICIKERNKEREREREKGEVINVSISVYASIYLSIYLSKHQVGRCVSLRVFIEQIISIYSAASFIAFHHNKIISLYLCSSVCLSLFLQYVGLSLFSINAQANFIKTRTFDADPEYLLRFQIHKWVYWLIAFSLNIRHISTLIYHFT